MTGSREPHPVLLELPWSLLRWIANTPDTLRAMTAAARAHPPPQGWRWEVKVVLWPIRYGPVRGAHPDLLVLDEISEMEDPPDTSWIEHAPIGDKASWELSEQPRLFHGAPSEWGPGKVHLARWTGITWTSKCREYPGYLMPEDSEEPVSCSRCKSLL